MRKALLRSALAAAALGSLLLGGCASTAKNPEQTGRTFAPRNYTGVDRLPYGLRRVVLLPVAGGNVIPDDTKVSLDPIFVTALERQERFEVVTISREEMEATFDVPEVSSAAALPPNFLSELAQKYAAQGVMFVDITSYDAYGPLVIGIRAKLAEVGTHGLLWSFDEIFSTANPAVASSLRRFDSHNGRANVPSDMSIDALSSPSALAAYAADATFHTLPPP